jgi:tetratricopeptide (TPR) repeat protein
MMLRCAVWIIVWNVAVCLYAAHFNGQVHHDTHEGEPIPNVDIQADGANPTATDKDGEFRLSFPGKRLGVGDVVVLKVRKEGYVVVHDIMLYYNLPRSPSPKSEILLAKPADKEDKARQFFLRKSIEAAEGSHARIATDKHLQGNATTLGEFKKKLEQAKAFAEKTVDEFAWEQTGQAPALYQNALRLFLDGNSKAALEKLDECLKKQMATDKRVAQDLLKTYRLKGYILTLELDFPGATDAYERAAKAAPDDFAAHFALALLLQSQNQPTIALATYIQARDSARKAANKPDEAMTLSNMGILYRDEKKVKEARAAFDDALKLYRELNSKSSKKFNSDIQRVQDLRDPKN